MKPKEQQLASQIKKLHYELSFEHDLNRRLAEELRDYQQRFGMQLKKYKLQPEEISLVGLGTYMQELFYIEPLLLAYDDKLFKLEQLLSDLQEDSKGFEGKIAQVTSENNFLRTELESKCKALLERESTGMNARYLKLENDNLREKEELIKQENQQFRRQLYKLRDELQIALKDRSKATRMDELSSQLTTVKEELRQTQIKLIEKEKELELLRQKHRNETVMSSDHYNRTVELETERAKYLSENKVLQQQLDNLKYLQENALEQHHNELDTLKNQLRGCQRREAELFQKNLNAEAELQQKGNALHNLQLQASTLQTNNQNLLQMLESYEGKVAHQSKKVKKAEDDLKEAIENLKAQNKEKDLLEWKLAQKQQLLERRDLENRSERERLSKVYQQRMETVRASLQDEHERMEEQLSTLRSTNTVLETKCEKLLKENQQLKSQARLT